MAGPQILSTPRQLLRANQSLPPEQRQNRVRLCFRTPISVLFASEFYSIHLTGDMLSGGENEFCGVQRADLTARHVCPHCSSSMKRTGIWSHVCEASGCPNRGKSLSTKPPRGVTNVEVPSDQIDGDNRTNVVDLVLDRRYHDVVLAAVYRTAGEVCSIYGWELL